ncbi:hypothetical protein DFP73DRAFT_233999 [Morchella snyderi]|nr:hypothetical protein DFP73DRAFT_233999 [Morchella snyderi]
MSTPRSASPVPRLALQIPDPQEQHPAVASTMEIHKRHTVPYPSPSSSPNTLPPAPARSYTHPVGKDIEKHQQRYMNRMQSKLEPHLKTLDQAQRMSKEPQKESGPEDEPVPTFFISPGASNYPDDSAMLHEEFVAIGDLQDQDLDYIMRASGIQTAEYMPGPEEPIQEPTQKPLVTVDSPSEHQQMSLHPQSGTTQGLLVAPVVQGPISDSGVGSTMGSPGTLASNYANAGLQSFATVGSVTRALSGHARKISATSSLETEAGLGNGSLMGRPSLVPESGSSYTVASCQELTPPSSATLSPKSFLATQPELSRAMMDLESIHAIEKHLISPMMDNPEFAGLKKVLSCAKERMYQGQIRCLRDVEKYIMNMVNKMSPNVPPKGFFNTLFSGIQNAYPDVLEKDRVRENDTPYTKNYFLDQLALVSGGAMHYSNPQHRISKRRLSVDAEESVIKRPAVTPTSFNALGPFVKPVAKLRQNSTSKQQLGILTQAPPEVYNSCQLAGHPQIHIGNNSTFQYDENTKNTIAQSQSCDVRTYYQPTISQPWQSSGQLAMPTAMINHGGYSPATIQTSLTATSIIPFTMSRSEPTSAISAGSPLHSSPVSRANSKEPANYSCEFCQKSFPRPCDLTKHRKTHDRPFKCDDINCKYSIEGFPTNKEKERHQNDIHALNSKEWKCEFAPCPYKSKRESNCKQHMEKAHEYIYKRMKRNPRRRDQGVPVTPTRRKKNTSIANESQSSTPVMPNENLEIPQVSQPSDFPSLFIDNYLDPSQLPGNDYPWESPMTNTTDYDQSPLSIIPNNFEDYRDGSRTNPMMTGDWIMFDGVDSSVHQYRGISDFQHNFHPIFGIGNESAWNIDSGTVD